ncbi:hypothetical protein [Streptomyces cinereoruber]|uniref:hypothetical protein n=1 Tax=Streptomyces cinereoruber TaxID=67260 RepID=UPI003667DC9B
MSCQTCGHEAEGEIQPHNFGCAESLATQTMLAPSSNAPLPQLATAELDDLCAKDDCTNRRAVSKGPRAAKYCDEHKSVRSK